MRLFGLNKTNAELVTNVNTAALECASVLLRDRGMVIFEEVLIRSGHRKNRGLVQWRAIRRELEDGFSVGLIAMSRTFLRDQISAQFDPLRVLADVERYLVKGNGHETAGFCFPAKHADLTKRQIEHRRHVAEGYERAAVKLEQELDVPLPAPPPGILLP